MLPFAMKDTSRTIAGKLGHEYCFSAYSGDVADNMSAQSAPRCTAIPLDDRSLQASAGWSRVSAKSFFNGTAMQASAGGRTLTRAGAIAGRAAVVVDKGRGFGSIVVLYNGKVVKTISLAASKTLTKQLITLPRILRLTKIVIKTMSSRRVQIDGLLLARI